MAEAFEKAFNDLFEEEAGLADAGDWISKGENRTLDDWVKEINKSCGGEGGCKFPGSGESATNFKNTYINENGDFTQEWMKNTEITKGADDEALYQFSGKYKYTDSSGATVTRKAPPLKARQIREIFRGQGQLATTAARNPLLNGTDKTTSIFEHERFGGAVAQASDGISAEALSNYHELGANLKYGGKFKVGDEIFSPDIPEGCSGSKCIVHSRKQINNIMRKHFAKKLEEGFEFTRDMFPKDSNGKWQVPYKRNFMGTVDGVGALGLRTPLYGNDPLSILQMMGAIEDNGLVTIGGSLKGTAEDLSEAMQNITEERLNKGMTLDYTKDPPEWTSGCEAADANCGARAVFQNMTNEAFEAVQLLDSSEPEAAQKAAAAAKKVSQLESELSSAFNAGASTESVIAGADAVNEAVESIKGSWRDILKNGSPDEQKLLQTYDSKLEELMRKNGLFERSYNPFRKSALIKGLVKQEYVDALEKMMEGDEALKGMVDRLKKSKLRFANSFGPNGINDGGGMMAANLKAAGRLENLYDDMFGEDGPLKDASDEVKKDWRKMHGLPEDGGWWERNEGIGPSPGRVINESEAPETLESILDKIGENGTEEESMLAKAFKKIKTMLYYLGVFAAYSSLFELLLAHSEAMSGCFLVPLAVQDRDGKVIQSYANTSYKINQLTCKQSMKTWGSGYVLGIPLDNQDWFGTAVFGQSPNQKGGKVMAAGQCLRGGRCDDLALPTANFFHCNLPPGPNGKSTWNKYCPPESCLSTPAPASCGMTKPGPGGESFLKCYPDSSPAGVSPGGQQYIYDRIMRVCRENDKSQYGAQWISNVDNSGGQFGETGTLADGCNFKCTPPKSSSVENFTASSPGTACDTIHGAGVCKPGESCIDGFCKLTNQACKPNAGSPGAVPTPGIENIFDVKKMKGYCSNQGGSWNPVGAYSTCNPGQDGSLVNCSGGKSYNDNPVYTNCMTGGVNFATGGGKEGIFNGFCPGKSYQTHNWPSGVGLGIDGMPLFQDLDVDVQMPLCVNNPTVASPGYDQSTGKITLDPGAPIMAKPAGTMGNDKGTTNLTCIKPSQFFGENTTTCVTDGDCADGENGDIQICVGASGGYKLGSKKVGNAGQGYCVSVPSVPAGPGTLKDSQGRSYANQCGATASDGNLQSCISPPSGSVAAICSSPDNPDASAAPGGSWMGTRGVCLSIDQKNSKDQNQRNYVGTPFDPNPCANDTADACSVYCTANGPNGVQVPDGYTLSCQSSGILGAAADLLERAVNLPAMGDPFGGVLKVLMWVGIALGIGIVILGILSLFIKRLEKALFGWL